MAAIGNFEAIISNRVCQISIKFRFFSSLQLWQISWISPLFGSIRTAVSNTQNPTHTHSRLSAAHTITMSLFYQTITVPGSDLCEGGSRGGF